MRTDTGGYRPLEERFWEKVNRGEPDECWEWTAATHPFGHGKIWNDGEMRYAHRISYTLERGDPGDELVLHKCDNPPCVNPDHLYLGDHGDNIQDAADRDRRPDISGEGAPTAKLSEEDVKEILGRLDSGEKHADIAEDHGVSPSTVSMISAGENWTEVNL